MLIPIFFSPFPVFGTFLKAVRRKVSLPSTITLPSTQSFIKQHQKLQCDSERSPLHTNWHFARATYHLSLSLRSFRAKPKLIEDDANRLRKLNLNSHIFEFATACLKIKILRMRKNVIVFL